MKSDIEHGKTLPVHPVAAEPKPNLEEMDKARQLTVQLMLSGLVTLIALRQKVFLDENKFEGRKYEVAFFSCFFAAILSMGAVLDHFVIVTHFGPNSHPSPLLRAVRGLLGWHRLLCAYGGGFALILSMVLSLSGPNDLIYVLFDGTYNMVLPFGIFAFMNWENMVERARRLRTDEKI